jgi:hypothetical protein
MRWEMNGIGSAAQPPAVFGISYSQLSVSTTSQLAKLERNADKNILYLKRLSKPHNLPVIDHKEYLMIN